jgi:hypothetical protein
MRPLALSFAAVLGIASWATAQAPNAPKQDFANSSIVVKMMAFNKKNDGKLTKDEVTDARLHRLFDMADANKDGIVTKEELIAVAAKLAVEPPPGGPKGFGPKGKGPPPKGGPDGPKGQ